MTRTRAVLCARLSVAMDGSQAQAGRRSGVGFDGESVAVWVLEPRDTTTAGSSGDARGVMLEFVVAGELDAGGGELVNDLLDVVDIPGRHCRG